jgi:hypothetical protein
MIREKSKLRSKQTCDVLIEDKKIKGAMKQLGCVNLQGSLLIS